MAGSKIKLGEVTYFSDEHPKHKVKNLITRTGKWTSPIRFQGDLICEFSLPTPARITRIDLGNYWSASVEISVGLESWPSSKREVLASHNFMNRLTSLSGDNKEQLLTITGAQFKEVTEKQWDRVRITCKQPYRFENDCFGLSMIDITGIQNRPSVDQGIEQRSPKVDDKDVQDFIEKKLQSIKSTFVKPLTSSMLVHASCTSRASLSSELLTETQPSCSQQSGSGARSGPRQESGHSLDMHSPATSRKEENNDHIIGPGTQKVDEDFSVKALNFLEKSFSTYEPKDLSAITFNNVRELWFNNFGSHVSPTEKKILKYLSRKYITDLLDSFETRDGLVQETPKTTGGDDENRKPEKKKSDIQLSPTRSRGSKENPSRREVGVEHEQEINRNKRKFNSHDDEEEKENRSKRVNRNSIISMDMRDDDETGDLNLVRSSKNKGNALKSKNSDETPKKSLPKATERKRPSTGSKPKKKDTIIKAIPDKNGWIRTRTPSEGKIRMIEKNLSPLHKKSFLGYDICNLLRMPEDSLKKHGILFQRRDFKKSRDLPLKDGNSLFVEALAPVYFIKCGPNIHLIYQDRVYDPDVEMKFRLGLFKSHEPSEVLNNKPLSQEVMSIINNFTDEQEEQLGDARSCLNEEDDFSSVQIVYQGHKLSNVRTDSMDQCPLCDEFFSSETIQDHASECKGPSEGTAWVPLDTCPLCSKKMDPDILAEHAADCTGELVDETNATTDMSTRESTTMSASTSDLESSSRPGSSSDKKRPTQDSSTSGCTVKGERSGASQPRTPKFGEMKPPKYGDCPVCDRRMKFDELEEHAMGCQGFERNGGNGLHVNVMDSQRKCDFCEQLIPEVVMDEHVDDCPARGVRNRVLTPIQKRRERFANTHRSNYF